MRNSPPHKGGVAQSAGVVLVKGLILLNQPPRRFAAPRLSQGGELFATCSDSTSSINVHLGLFVTICHPEIILGAPIRQLVTLRCPKVPPLLCLMRGPIVLLLFDSLEIGLP